MSQRLLSLAAIILVTLSFTSASMINSQPQFTIKAEKYKAFGKSCLIGTFEIKSGNIADCLEHCLKNCRCQSFQICQNAANTECQLCSSNKEENSSLLHDKNGCIYAMYEMRHLTETFQKLDDHCSGMSCLMKYNCCQQSGLCPENKICKPNNSLKPTWKRFTCECPDGYHGDNCSEPIKSCGRYLDGPRESGMYKVMDSNNSVYEVYCHFDSDGTWTLVHSYSYANGVVDNSKFNKPLYQDLPISENDLIWSGYRLSKSRMKSIIKKSSLLLFTCEYEKTRNIEESDYLQLSLNDIIPVDVVGLHGYSSGVWIQHGKIGGIELPSNCASYVYQDDFKTLHGRSHLLRCSFTPTTTSGCRNDSEIFALFGNYNGNHCFEETHRCSINGESTTQLWFGN